MKVRRGRVTGKTLLNPKKDSKWERGRTRQVLHFGAHVRGGKAVGAEVEEIPPCLREVLRMVEARGLLECSSQQGDQGAGAGHGKRVTAATVDFFRKGSYSPALAATASVFVPPSSTPPKSAQAAGTTGDKSCRDSALGESGSDTEAVVCMIWLQAGGEVVVGSAHQLANCSKGPQEKRAKDTQIPPNEMTREKKEGARAEGKGERGEGLFPGMERVLAPQGSVMMWNSARAQGLQVAVPSASRDAILVSFQTLTPEASSRVIANRRERKEAKTKAKMFRKAAKEAKEAKEAKGPIPGTPIVVADWEERGNEDGDRGMRWRPEKDDMNSSCSADAERGGEDDGRTPSIEKEHVQAVYDTIAPHWSHTRYKPWPRVEKFLSELEPCSFVADAGCGNGKYLGCDAAGGFLVGSDTSVNLLHVCKERLPKAEVLASDCMRLPYRSGVFDAAISIAVLHHFSSEVHGSVLFALSIVGEECSNISVPHHATKVRRLRALTELCRLVRPGGRLLVYAWAIEQEQDSRRSFAAQDVLVPWHLADHHNRSQGRGTDDDGSSGNTMKGGQESEEPATANVERSGASALAKGTEDGAVAAGDSKSHAGGVVAPTPTAPRHGVRVDGVAGTAGSVVYQRYCHVYAEGELEGLVERVDGLRLVENYYDRSNWCVVAEREM
ncbi:unnamed protein product [Ectocarpus sp. CCAP 1310/34]|nr:unnamed protein product [Ectocarpus sp. CCAP 1310/34]